MKYLKTDWTFTVSMSKEAHRIAEKFRRQQVVPAKGDRVYRNTLAVLAVNFYCRCMGIETDLSASDSWDMVMQTLADVADLEIKNLGKLECRPVLSDSQMVEIPAEVWGDRIGYIAVELNESMSEATLVGFVKEVATEELPKNKWRSLEEFLEQISVLERAKPEKELVKLSKWLEQIVDAGWETVEALLGDRLPEIAYNFRSTASMRSKISPLPAGGVKRGKLLDLQRADDRVALLVGLTPATEPEMDIWVEVYPTGTQTYLPQDLQLAVIDEKGKAVMQAESCGSDKVRFQFKGELGERFGVKVALGDVTITEEFLI